MSKSLVLSSTYNNASKIPTKQNTSKCAKGLGAILPSYQVGINIGSTVVGAIRAIEKAQCVRRARGWTGRPWRRGGVLV